MISFFLRRYISGFTPQSAIERAKTFSCSDMGVSINLLGEHVNEKEQVGYFRRNYIDLIRLLTSEKFNVTISVKLTMLGLSIDKHYCMDNLDAILRETCKRNIFVRIDMEESKYTKDTLDIFFEMIKRYPKKVGVVLQAMLFRTKEDIEAVSEYDGDIRLCKGAYKESSKIAYQDMDDIRHVYKQYAQKLLNRGLLVRFATHDDILIDWIRDYVKQERVGYSCFEFQMILGFREQTIRSLAQKGYMTRVYIPYGRYWLPYFYRRLRERKENVYFVLRHLFKH